MIFPLTREVNIREVRTFDGANPDDINILFSTTAGLHNQMLIAKENEMSLETIGDYKVVLLADEAHNLSVDTNKRLSGREELEVESWEKTVLRILKSNPESENILLEFTATARLDSGSQEIIEKYTDKALYKYSLKEYRADGYSKEVNTPSNFDGVTAHASPTLNPPYMQRKSCKRYLDLFIR